MLSYVKVQEQVDSCMKWKVCCSLQRGWKQIINHTLYIWYTRRQIVSLILILEVVGLFIVDLNGFGLCGGSYICCVHDFRAFDCRREKQRVNLLEEYFGIISFDFRGPKGVSELSLTLLWYGRRFVKVFWLRFLTFQTKLFLFTIKAHFYWLFPPKSHWII